MKTAIIIPARYQAVRLPGKPLLNETGTALIVHVLENARAVEGVAELCVATDDERIAKVVESAGFKALLTRDDHQSGTDRLAEAVESLDVDLVINLQGDEPTVDPQAVSMLIEAMQADPDCQMGTLATSLLEHKHYLDPDTVKVVCDDQMNALYFSRSPIPHYRSGVEEKDLATLKCWKHIGVYAYHKDFLQTFASWPVADLEAAEKLEQLRALAHGVRIKVLLTDHDSHGIDTVADYRHFVDHWKVTQSQKD